MGFTKRCAMVIEGVRCSNNIPDKDEICSACCEALEKAIAEEYAIAAHESGGA
jgi:hypothetical protein